MNNIDKHKLMKQYKKRMCVCANSVGYPDCLKVMKILKGYYLLSIKLIIYLLIENTLPHEAICLKVILFLSLF